MSPLGLGCSRVGSFNNPKPLAESRALIRTALDLGVTVIDTSNIYGQGDSEAQIGLALAGRRDSAFIVTKTGRGFSTKMRLLRPLKPVLRPLLAARKGGAVPSGVTARREGELRMNWAPEAFGPSLDASLRRLRTDRVDGFLLHSPPAEIAGDPAVGRALGDLKSSGKVVHFGVSCDDLPCLEAALAMPGLTLLQLPWDVIEAIAATPLAARIHEQGIIVLAREVIRLQPALAPVDAVRHAATNPLVSSVLVGTSSDVHLRALAKAVA